MSKELVNTKKREIAPDLPEGESIDGKTSGQELLMKSLSCMVDGVAKTFGPRCEVVLHDLSNLDRSIVKIANGHVTGRTVGGSITDYGLKFLKGGSQENFLANYPSRTKDGRLLKSTTMIFRDESGKPIAAICINLDVTDIIQFTRVIQDIFSVQKETERNGTMETFEGDIVSTLSRIVDESIGKFGKAISSMGKEDKIEIVRELEDQGLFMIKGAVKLVAGQLNVSKFTVYNYLDQVRNRSLKSNVIE